MQKLIIGFCQLLIFLAVAPLVSGIIQKIKAFFQHRKGASVLQPYFHIWKLIKKEQVFSSRNSWMIQLTPCIYFSVILLAALFIPVIPQFSAAGFSGDAIFIIYLMGLARFFTTLSALDSGCFLGGMGSSRMLLVSIFIKPALMIVILTMALSSSTISSSFHDMYLAAYADNENWIRPSMVLLFASVSILLVIETNRINIAASNTQHELTMVQEATLLEYSGRGLALMQYGNAVKQLIFITLAINLFLPWGTPTNQEWKGMAAALGMYLVKILCVSFGMGVIQSSTLRLRLINVFHGTVMAFALAFLGFLSACILGR